MSSSDQQNPFGSPPSATEAVAANPQQTEIISMKLRLESLSEQMRQLHAKLNNPRVRIQNFEGVFKVVSSVPSNSDDYQDGSVLLYDDGSSTRRIYAKMNKTWRYATLT